MVREKKNVGNFTDHTTTNIQEFLKNDSYSLSISRYQITIKQLFFMVVNK